MMLPAVGYAVAPSLADPEGFGPFVAAVRWIEGAALGTIATSVALIAVATVGLLMLSGRLPVRRSASVILGCFILFGAPTIATGLLSAVQTAVSGEAPIPPILEPTPLPEPGNKATPAYDPYAGAAVPTR